MGLRIVHRAGVLGCRVSSPLNCPGWVQRGWRFLRTAGARAARLPQPPSTGTADITPASSSKSKGKIAGSASTARLLPLSASPHLPPGLSIQARAEAAFPARCCDSSCRSAAPWLPDGFSYPNGRPHPLSRTFPYHLASVGPPLQIHGLPQPRPIELKRGLKLCGARHWHRGGRPSPHRHTGRTSAPHNGVGLTPSAGFKLLLWRTRPAAAWVLAVGVLLSERCHGQSSTPNLAGSPGILPSPNTAHLAQRCGNAIGQFWAGQGRGLHQRRGGQRRLRIDVTRHTRGPHTTSVGHTSRNLAQKTRPSPSGCVPARTNNFPLHRKQQPRLALGTGVHRRDCPQRTPEHCCPTNLACPESGGSWQPLDSRMEYRT